MDDYNISSLNTSQHEWAIKLLNILVPCIIEGIDSIFKEAFKLCKENNENEKYLMTFQNLLSRIPKWNNNIISSEVARIVESSKCNYLEDLISCVHISHLKILTSVRVGKSQKKITINVPVLNEFIHNVYINCGRKLYTVVYLFEKDIQPLIHQRYKNEIEEHVKNSILNTIRDSIPVEEILRAYMDESTDIVASSIKEEIKPPVEPETETETESTSLNEVEETSKASNIKIEKTEEVIKDPNDLQIDTLPMKDTVTLEQKPLIKLDVEENKSNKENENVSLTFSEVDNTIDINKNEEAVTKPKDFDTLEQISIERNNQRKLEEEEEEEEEDKIKISNEKIELDTLDIQNVLPELSNQPLLSDVEVLV